MKVQQQLIKAIHLPFDKSDRGKSFFLLLRKNTYNEKYRNDHYTFNDIYLAEMSRL